MTIQQLMEIPGSTITRKVAAKAIGCDPRTVTRGCLDGIIKHIQLGNRILILKEPLIALLTGGARFVE
jgi:hypothetical protein